MPPKPRPVRDLFFAKTQPQPNTGCLLWTASLNDKGYGYFRISGKTCLAHRVAWFLDRGEIPAGASCLHRCDTPACVNVEHLFLGTQAENMGDMAGKHRACSKLTAQQVREIRGLHMEMGFTQTELSRQYGVTQAQISDVVTGRSWKHVSGPLRNAGRTGRPRKARE